MPEPANLGSARLASGCQPASQPASQSAGIRERKAAEAARLCVGPNERLQASGGGARATAGRRRQAAGSRQQPEARCLFNCWRARRSLKRTPGELGGPPARPLARLLASRLARAGRTAAGRCALASERQRASHFSGSSAEALKQTLGGAHLAAQLNHLRPKGARARRANRRRRRLLRRRT